MAIDLSILMCAYNEERTIVEAVQGVLNTEFPCEIQLIVVDDGSTDATALLLSQIHDRRLIKHRHRTNRGKGAALRTAAAMATGTYLLPFDADMEYLPEDIPKLLIPVLSRRCEVVFGVRLFGYNTVYHSYRYAVGNRMLTRVANVLYDAYLSDLHTCLKLIPLEMFKSMKLSAKGFGLDSEITAMLLRKGVRPFEVPVSYYGRSHAAGKKITWRDGLACLMILLRVRLARRSSLDVALAPRELAYPGATAEHVPHGIAHSSVFTVATEGDGIGTSVAN